MRKILFSLTILLSLLSCTNAEREQEDNGSIDQSKIVGVWKSGDYFISLSSNNYYIAYLSNTFIDSGNYSISGNTITCQNNYFAKTTMIDVKIDNDGELNCKFTYIDGEGQNKILNQVFKRSSDTPAQSNNIIIGKSDTWIISWGDGTLSNAIGDYTTSNGGYETVLTGNLKGVKRNVYYVYLHPTIYYQRYQAEDNSHGTNSFNKDILTVSKKKVIISQNGSVSFEIP